MARVNTDLTIRPLTPELDWDQYLDLSFRAFGPQEESRIRANIEAVVADGRALGAFDGDRLAGTAVFYDLRQWWYGLAVPMAGVAGAPAAISARGFPATDISVPLQLTDDLLPANSGRWDLTVQAGSGSLSSGRTEGGAAPGNPDTPAGPEPLALGSRGLAALYAGTPVATLRRAGLAHGGSADADAALDGAFAATPFMLDGF